MVELEKFQICLKYCIVMKKVCHGLIFEDKVSIIVEF